MLCKCEKKNISHTSPNFLLHVDNTVISTASGDERDRADGIRKSGEWVCVCVWGGSEWEELFSIQLSLGRHLLKSTLE